MASPRMPSRGAGGVVVASPLSLQRTQTNEHVVVMFRTMTNQSSKQPSTTRPHYYSIFDRIFGRKTTTTQNCTPQITVHKQTLEQVCQLYSTHPTLGLEDAVVNRLASSGKKNQLSPPPSNAFKKWMSYVFGGFNSLMWLAMILSFLSYQPLGSLQGGVPQVFNLGVGFLLGFVVILSTLFYAFVDYNASEVMKSITMLSAESATVVRNGKKSVISAKELYVGDLVVLGLGDKVPADIYLTEASFDLKFDKSLLTGESDPIPGTVQMTDENPLETKNLALSSTLVVQGTMTGIVFNTGDDTVVGKVVTLTSSNTNVQTPLQREIERFAFVISLCAISMFAISMLFWGLNTQVQHPGFASVSGSIINAIGCLTAFVPQGLPVCVALSLTVIARRMAAKSVLVKNLATVETVGSMSILCSDKTGTLTEGKMFVQQFGNIKSPEYQDAKELLKTPNGKNVLIASYLCNDAYEETGDAEAGNSVPVIHGNSTDVAVFRYAKDALVSSKDFLSYKKVFNLPFNSKNKWMATILEGPDGLLLLAKGAPDVLLKSATTVTTFDGKEIELNQENRGFVDNLQTKWSEEGQRVLVICSKKLGIEKIPQSNLMEDFIIEQMSGLSLITLAGIRDPPRPSVPPSVKAMRAAGIRVFMVTGDFRTTAAAIARQVNILTASHVYDVEEVTNVQKYLHHTTKSVHEMRPTADSSPKGIVLNGSDIDRFTKEHYDILFSEFEEIVFARTTPEQKMHIVQEAKARGDSIVGVTGDGVNDAPALKAADVGFAMGAGSDVAKQAAHMILLTNDFSSILVGIENGRLVFENLKKVLLYIMPSGSYTELMAVIANVFLGMQAPLTSYLQVAFCIFNDVAMSIALMFESSESDSMSRRPRNVRLEGLTNWQFFFQIFCVLGLWTWLSCFGIYFYYWKTVGFGFFDISGAWDNWTDGYLGHSIADLNAWVSISQGVFYVAMAIMQLGNLMAIRNRRVSILESNPFYGPRQNLAIFPAIAFHLFVTCMNVYVSSAPGNPNIFAIGYVPGIFWLIPLPLALGIIILDEIRKLLVRTCPDSIVAKAAW